MKKVKAIGGTFSLVYHGVLSKPLPYNATGEEIEKAGKQLVAKVKRNKERAEAESTHRATPAPAR